MTFKKKLSALFILTMALSMGAMVSTKADNQDISDLEDEISGNQKKYEDIQNQLDELNAAKDDLEDYMVKLNTTYESIQSTIEDLDEQIDEKNVQIEEANGRIAELDIQIAEQYEDMKLRIQYIYESNNASYMDVFLSSESMGEILERMEYISSIMKYDEEQMDKYKLNVTEMENLKASLETEKKDIEVLKAEQQEQEENLDAMMDEASENIAAHKEQIEEAEAAALAMEEKLEAQKNSLEALKAEEERRKKEEEERKKQQAAGIVTEKVEYQELDGDIKRMAAIIYCEARGESYEGQLAVGTVVMNRVESTRFPNTIEGVITQSGQFSPYASGRYAMALAMDDMQQSCIDAAIEVVRNGKRTGDWLFFRTINGIINGTFIGNHVFY